MTMHYHGTPMHRPALLALAGHCFCVPYGGHAALDEVAICHEVGQSVMLDNGAYAQWRRGGGTDWNGFYLWAEPWLEHHTTWAVIPDVIDGSEADNDALLDQWPFDDRGAPVWHLHESIERLIRLCGGYSRVCLGSSGEFATIGTDAWYRRMDKAMNAICDPTPPVWLHMLRGMALSGSEYPFASVDSSDIARHHSRGRNDPAEMARRWGSMQCPARWVYREQLVLEST